MIENKQLKRDSYIKKLVSNARAIISNQIALPLGVHKMDKILTWVNQIEPLKDIDLKIFTDYNSKTVEFSIGIERLFCNREFLKKQDEQLNVLTEQYREKIIDKCFEIVNKFADKK